MDQRRRNLACWETELKPKGVSWGGSFEDPAKSAGKRKFLERPQARRLFRLPRSQGRVSGGRKDRKPYGYIRRPDNRLTPDHAERRVLEYMLRRHCVDRVCDRERIAREIQDMAEKGALKVCRAWNGNKIKAAIAAFWRIVRDEGVEWIQDAGVKDYAVSALK